MSEPKNELKFEVILFGGLADTFTYDADQEERGMSPHARFCIKKYYEWREELVRLRKLETDFQKMSAELVRLRQFVAGAPSGALPGPDFRPATLKPDLRENAG